jgi:hypothetical protein
MASPRLRSSRSPGPDRGGAPNAKGNRASLDFLWHEFLTSGLLEVRLFVYESLTRGGRWSKIRAIEKFKAKNPSLLRKFVP